MSRVSYGGELRRELARRQSLVVGFLAVVWVAGAAVYGWHVARQVILGDLACESRPGRSSVYGQADWQWWYPGTACRYSGADTGGVEHVDRPGVSSGVIALVLLVVLLGFGVLVARARARRSGIEAEADAVERA